MEFSNFFCIAAYALSFYLALGIILFLIFNYFRNNELKRIYLCGLIFFWLSNLVAILVTAKYQNTTACIIFILLFMIANPVIAWFRPNRDVSERPIKMIGNSIIWKKAMEYKKNNKLA